MAQIQAYVLCDCPHMRTPRMIKRFHYTLTRHWYILRQPNRRSHDVTKAANTVPVQAKHAMTTEASTRQVIIDWMIRKELLLKNRGIDRIRNLLLKLYNSCTKDLNPGCINLSGKTVNLVHLCTHCACASLVKRRDKTLPRQMHCEEGRKHVNRFSRVSASWARD